MKEGNSALFEIEMQLPDARLTGLSSRLVGFAARYRRIRQALLLLLDSEGLQRWTRDHYGSKIPLLDALADRYPLIIFHGDIGTGKTVTAEAAANAVAKDLQKEAMLFKLSTRVRGSGNVGEMSTLINQAFDILAREAGRAKLSFLIIDEADSLTATRNENQIHHEDKVAVNTLIQKIDDARRFDGRVLVMLCTNRYSALDPAIVRRAALTEEFLRPDDDERREVFNIDCAGLGFSRTVIDQLVAATGPKGRHRPGFTYSDIRTRLLPEAVGLAFPNRKLSPEDLLEVAQRLLPSPTVTENA